MDLDLVNMDLVQGYSTLRPFWKKKKKRKKEAMLVKSPGEEPAYTQQRTKVTILTIGLNSVWK
jgi:hypothetical protein